MAHIYSGDVFQRAVAKEHLEARLELNKKYQSTDFDSWLMDRLDARPGEFVLDVGCGTGAQSIPFLQRVGPQGAVCSLDISEASVLALRQKAANAGNLTAVTADMGDLARVINEEFPHKEFDLAQSSYALYYSPNRMNVLDTMKGSLKQGGRLAVFTPNRPHGMVEFARRLGPIPSEVDESIQFGPAILEPYFRENFWDVTVSFFHNIVTVPDVEDVMLFYRATTYYREPLEKDFRALALEQIAKFGVFRYEKNGYLIIGRNPIQPS
jgi:SAM-dependent methyltransferase